MTSERIARLALEVGYVERADGTPVIEVVRVGGTALPMTEDLRLAVLAALVRGGYVGDDEGDAVRSEVVRAIG